ncbi:MAG: hypothetical protein C4576_13500 [Desulfobacteraceae bacterium]|nr:MAG: hypothetical protein C4576_13500 [Desulfobacteraceae bacterium]
MAASLNERFKVFVSQLPFAEVIDDLDLPPGFDGSKRADFLVENRKAIIELKSLEADPEPKINNELESHQSREEYPLFYGEMELSKVLKHLPDGDEIQKKLFYKISRSIEQSFREANRQIQSTKDILNCPNSIGLLVLLNEKISVLSPEVIAYRVSQLLTRTDTDGSLHYKSITSVWVIFENFSLKSNVQTKLLPSIVIDGPSAEEWPDLGSVVEMLQRGWARFNGLPYATSKIGRVSDSQFVRLSELEKQNQKSIHRHEVWRKQYRDNPYLKALSDDAVLSHGARLVSFMAPNFLKGGTRIPFDQMVQFMEGWTHFLEEVRIRGLDLKKFQKMVVFNQKL